MAEKQSPQAAAELQDEALDAAHGGNLGDTATHEIGHIRAPRISGDPDRPIVIGSVPNPA